MRTLKLTHEQIELITQALGMAEAKYCKIHKELMDEIVRVRRAHPDQEKNAKVFHDMASMMADMNIDIQGGKFDV